MAKSCMVRSYKALSFRCGPDETRNLNDHYTSIYASLRSSHTSVAAACGSLVGRAWISSPPRLAIHALLKVHAG